MSNPSQDCWLEGLVPSSVALLMDLVRHSSGGCCLPARGCKGVGLTQAVTGVFLVLFVVMMFQRPSIGWGPFGIQVI